jgi:hypothetical protein
MKTGVLVAGGVVAVALGVADTAYRIRGWGATAGEIATTLPGDELVAGPTRDVTRGVTVHAAPEEVWRWVVEVGRVRGGVELVPGRSMLLLGSLDDAAAQAPRDGVTTLHVLPFTPPGGHVRADAGADGDRVWARLVCRSRSRRRDPVQAAAGSVLEPVAMVLTRRLLLGIKDRAECAALRAAVSGVAQPAVPGPRSPTHSR